MEIDGRLTGLPDQVLRHVGSTVLAEIPTAEKDFAVVVVDGRGGSRHIV